MGRIVNRKREYTIYYELRPGEAPQRRHPSLPYKYNYLPDGGSIAWVNGVLDRAWMTGPRLTRDGFLGSVVIREQVFAGPGGKPTGDWPAWLIQIANRYAEEAR